MSRFEAFTKSWVALGRDPHLTIQRRGTITLNAAAHAVLDSPQAVELVYDHDDDVLSLLACDPGPDHAAFVRPSTRSPNGPCVVSAMAFLRYYEIDTSEARQFPAELRSEVLCAYLGGPFGPVGKQRRPRPRPTA